MKNQKFVNFFSGIFLYMRYTCAVPYHLRPDIRNGTDKGRRKGEENRDEIFSEEQRFENNNTGGKRMFRGVHPDQRTIPPAYFYLERIPF
ncbi:MAG: hypothetical protein J0H55_08450 [Chitinophagaceae bacterium]|nr:hypothetical protein [Chitinophagaceae bacterium]